MKATSPIRVLVVDDHPIAREGLKAILNSESGVTVVGEAATGEAAIIAFQQQQPDVTVMDLHLPGISGVEAICLVRRQSPTARFVVLTSYDSDTFIRRALEAGAQAYLFKDMVREELTAAIRAVANGSRYFPMPVASRLIEHLPAIELTARERDVLRLIAMGHANKEIAAALHITEFTVKAHVQNIMMKLQAGDRAHAVAIAIQRDLLLPF